MTDSSFSCRICGQKAHGNHFGVYTCRACAAFFRRYATSSKWKWVNAKCKRNGNKETCMCRPCRLRKCVKMGMDTKKFQYDRDAILLSESSSISIIPSVSYFVARPEFLLFCDSNQSRSEKVFIDVQHLISEASRLLNHGCETPVFAENQLKKLTLGLKLLRFDGKKVKYFERVGQDEFMDIIEFYFIKVTKWIMHFDEFQKLNESVQLTLVQSFWHIWCKIHKCSTTAMYRKSNNGAKPMQKILRNMCMDREKATLDTSWMSDYPQEYVKKYMLSHNLYDFDITESISKLEPTDVELTYMFAQLCFEYAGKRFQGDIQKVTDHFQQILSNDLHNYYVYEQKHPRYMHRLAELMKVNNLIQRSTWETRPRRELGRVFNILKISFSHPEMFFDSGFY